MNINKIYIPLPNAKNIGGPFTFLKNLEQYLSGKKYRYCKKLSLKCCGTFFVVSIDLKKLKNFKKAKLPIIQRLDGVYYYSKHGLDYRKKNSDIKEIYGGYSTRKVFQSLYCRNQCFELFGEIPLNDYTIICNGVNKNIFFPAKRKASKEVIKFITTGNFRNLDMIEPVVKALDKLKSDYNFELNIVGPIVNEELNKYTDREYIKLYSSRKLHEIADLLRDNDVFLYSHLNPPCPNSVLEAISCGLPIVGFDSGAMSELCFFNKELLAYVSDDVVQKYEDFDYRKLAEKIKLSMDNFSKYREIALNNAHLYDFNDCGEKYVEVFKQELNRVKCWQKLLFIYFMFNEQSLNKAKKNMKKIFHKIINMILKLFVFLHEDKIQKIIIMTIDMKIKRLKSANALEFLFQLDNELYSLQGRESVRYGGGLHTKHKHINYHAFFIENIERKSRVLDIGCGNGALAYDIAKNINNVNVCGIDINKGCIEIAKLKYSAKNITYILGDALKSLPEEQFDVIVLSNVLEHIEFRVDFLKKIIAKYFPQKILIRVPIFERDWRVPLKEELGIDYRLDTTHYIEYRQNEFWEEMKKTGLNIIQYQINWGEIWAVCVSV